MLGDILVVLSDFGQLRRRSSPSPEEGPIRVLLFWDENTKRFLRQTEDFPNSVLML